MPESVSVKVETNLPAAMRDGVVLYADVYRPDGPGPFPVILQRTPYDKSSSLSSQMLDPIKAAKSGFALIIQDTRGRFTSEGEFYCFSDDVDDGYDTVEWAAALPWSNGKVGMVGASYVGATQWLAAITRPPHLVTLAPNVTASNYHDGWTYQGGAFELAFNVSWTLNQLTLANYEAQSRGKNVPPERQQELLQAVDGLTEAYLSLPLNDLSYLKDGLATYYYDWLAHPDFDDYWKALCIEDQHSNITTPALHTGGWYDIFLGGTIRNFLGMRKSGATDEARSGQKLIIGPWPHSAKGTSQAGSHYFGVAADAMALGLDEIHLRWFDYWLNGVNNGILDEAPVQIFVMGDNVWREEQEWPLARAQNTEYYLHSGGKANSRHGDGALGTQAPGVESSDVFSVQPGRPGPYHRRTALLQRLFRRQRGLRPKGYRGPRRCVDLLHAAVGTGRRGHWPDNRDTMGRHFGHRHRLHCQAGGRVRGRLRPEPDRRNYPGPVPRVHVQPHAGGAGPGLPVHHRPLGHQQRLPKGPPNPSGDFQQQLPPVRPEYQHR